MKEFLLLYRTDYSSIQNATNEEREQMMKKWMDWIGGIAAQNKLVTKGDRLHNNGKIVKSNVVTNGPYTDIKETIGGYSIIKAADYDEAIEFAKGCPVLLTGGNVEVREVDKI